MDVRSPSEFAIDHIPGAVNIPVFDDAERAVIGDTYRNVNRKQARFLGLDYIEPKLGKIMRELDALAQNHSLVLYCWRGGMRSQSLHLVALLMGIHCWRLKAGYKDYRACVKSWFEQACPFKVGVLHGLTGVGKTNVLKVMEERGNCQVVDLEGIAQNRGSAFGDIGIPHQPSQKRFESLLWSKLAAFDPAKPVLVECESRRIGRLLIPESFFAAMKKGPSLLAYAPVETRIETILADYKPEDNLEGIINAINMLKKSLGNQKVLEYTQMAKTGNFSQLVECLLEDYYDPLYKYPQGPDDCYDFGVDCSELQQAAVLLEDYLSKAGG